jgi:hypothetical protein
VKASPYFNAVRLAATAFVALLVPAYWSYYGPLHFLWLSDIALFATLLALWLRSRLLNSMMAIGLLPLEAYWSLEFFTRLLTGFELTGATGYMFDEERPLLVRALSLFHVPLVVIWIWLLLKWGYDKRALIAQTLLLWSALLATYSFTDPERNINWVFAPRSMQWDWMPEPLWLVLYMVLMPLVVHWPMHRFLSGFLRNRRGSRS